jgi:hypothetical protein
MIPALQSVNKTNSFRGGLELPARPTGRQGVSLAVVDRRQFHTRSPGGSGLFHLGHTCDVACWHADIKGGRRNPLGEERT